MNNIDRLIYQGYDVTEIAIALEAEKPAKPGHSYFWDALKETGDVSLAVRRAKSEMRAVLGSLSAMCVKGVAQ